MGDFKINDRVRCQKYFQGTICAIIPEHRKPIKVIFDSGEWAEFTGRETNPQKRLYHLDEVTV